MMRPLRWLIPVALALAALPLAGCGDGDSIVNPIVFNDPGATEPTAGTWKTYVLASPSQFRPAAPLAQGTTEFQAQVTAAAAKANTRTQLIKDRIDFWNGGIARRWNEYARYLVRKRSMNPPRASRAFGLLSVGMYEAMVASYEAKYHYNVPHPSQFTGGPTVYGTVETSPAYVSDHIAEGRAACDILVGLFPSDAESTVALFGDLMTAEQYSGNHFQMDIDAAFTLGGQVAAAVNARGAGDNSAATGDAAPPAADSIWVPTPPAFNPNPQEPGCGKWKPWVLATGNALRAGKPPIYTSPEFAAQTREVYDVNKSLTDARKQLATFWADGAGTATPPGHWNQIATDLGVSRGLNEPRMSRMLALLGMAQADAFISCWETKYHYWCLRPITSIRQSIDSTWTSFITTPPFPSYPSGHSTTSGAASTVLGYIFPDDAVSLHEMGTEAMRSRLYGGIHYTFDNLTGFSVGNTIGARVIALGAHDGSPARPTLPDRYRVLQALQRPAGFRPLPEGARLEDAAD